MKPQALWIIVLAIAGAIGLRELFPKQIRIPSPPRIVTQYDTLRVLDTAWMVKLRHDTVKINVVERVTVTVPETVRVVPDLTGLTALQIAPKVGDSSLAAGFTVAHDSSGYLLNRWQTQLYTLGPLKSLTVRAGGMIGAQFYDPPKPSCGFFCTLKHYAVGGLIGYGSCRVGF